MYKNPEKTPKKITRQYLENAALFYLQRFATSAENLRRVMGRKIDKSCAFHDTSPDECYAMLDEMIARYTKSGLLDDKTFARAKTASLRRQGQSQKAIQMKLQQKGLGREDITTALADIDDSATAELDAAVTFVRRKKLGQGKKDIKKELAAMGRAGFSYDIAKKALDWKDEEE